MPRPKAVTSADQAMDLAVALIKKHEPFYRPVRAVKEADVWTVEVDVGPLLTKIATVKINAHTGEILEYVRPVTLV